MYSSDPLYIYRIVQGRDCILQLLVIQVRFDIIINTGLRQGRGGQLKNTLETSGKDVKPPSLQDLHRPNPMTPWL